MDEMKPLLSIGQTVEDYFMKAMLENLQRPSAFQYPNTNIRTAAHYLDNPKPDTGYCSHCGQPHDFEDSDY